MSNITTDPLERLRGIGAEFDYFRLEFDRKRNAQWCAAVSTGGWTGRAFVGHGGTPREAVDVLERKVAAAKERGG